MKWNKRMTKTLCMSMILLMFGSTYLIIDYCSMPSKEDKRWDGEFKPVTYKEFGDSRKSFIIGLGDGFVSNIESIFIHISLLFGGFRLVDFLFLCVPKNNIDISRYKQKFRKIINRIKNNNTMEK